MPTNLSILKYREKAHRKIVRVVKPLIWRFTPSNQSQPVFICGYGRSGTTMLVHIFSRDARIDMYDESDRRVFSDYMIDIDLAERKILGSHAPVVCFKPILDSYRWQSLIDRFTTCKILWAYRYYEDVARSALEKFGPAVPNMLKHLVSGFNESNWIVAGMPGEHVRLLRAMNWQQFADTDWMCLIWWSVNHSLLDHNLAPNRQRIKLLPYDAVVTQPQAYLKKVYSFIGLDYRPGLAAYVHARSVGRGKGLTIDDSVRALCDNVMERLDDLATKVLAFSDG